MGRLRNLGLVGALLGLVGVTLALLLSSCQEPVHERDPQEFFAGIVLSRGGIRDVRVFKDITYMHGLKYFYFQADQPQINRLVSSLDLRKSEEMPEHLPKMAREAASKAGWQFNWTMTQAYLAYYCNPDNVDGTNSSIDMLLVSNGQSIFVTQGYLPANITRTSDPSGCPPNPGMESMKNYRK
jgi:hypothetical protein